MKKNNNIYIMSRSKFNLSTSNISTICNTTRGSSNGRCTKCSIGDLKNVDASCPSEGDLLSYDEAWLRWSTSTPCEALSKCNIGDLKNVNTTGATNGSQLIYNENTEVWEVLNQSTTCKTCCYPVSVGQPAGGVIIERILFGCRIPDVLVTADAVIYGTFQAFGTTEETICYVLLADYMSPANVYGLPDDSQCADSYATFAGNLLEITSSIDNTSPAGTVMTYTKSGSVDDILFTNFTIVLGFNVPVPDLTIIDYDFSISLRINGVINETKRIVNQVTSDNYETEGTHVLWFHYNGLAENDTIDLLLETHSVTPDDRFAVLFLVWEGKIIPIA